MKRTRSVLICSTVLNSLLILLEVFGLSEVFFRYLPGTEPFEWYLSLTYYTNLSNILLLMGSAGMLVLDIRELLGKKSPSFPYLLKYVGTVTTGVTFCTIYFIAFTTGEWVYAVNVHGNMWLLMHTVCPILGLLSFCLADTADKLKKTDFLYPVGFTLLYTGMVLLLFVNGAKVPYASFFEGGQESMTLGEIFLAALPDNVLCVVLSIALIALNRRVLTRIKKEKKEG